MTPQASFMVVTPIEPAQMGALRALLASMNGRPGIADPDNALVPFGRFDRLHFARFVILDDATLGDAAVYGDAPLDVGPSLAFLGDCDGDADAFLTDLVECAGVGLRRIFGHCQGFAADGDLLAWMRDHDRPAAALYVNWIGRTVRQIHEEAALRRALASHLDASMAALVGKTPHETREALQSFVTAETEAGRLTLTAEEPTPILWWLGNKLHALGVPFLLLLISPLLAVYLPLFFLQLRRRERSDPEVVPPPEPEHVQRLAELEDHDITNQFSALGSVKPGLFRRWSLVVFLWLLNYANRHIYARGHLARVGTIHFARWVFLDDKQRMLFASNYDGSLESYMDDFINKVAFGLNLVFSNGLGYPHTDFLFWRGAKFEQKFKYFLRRHQLPTEVWYNAHPGLTAIDLERNTRIRAGLQATEMSDDAIRAWLKLI